MRAHSVGIKKNQNKTNKQKPWSKSEMLAKEGRSNRVKNGHLALKHGKYMYVSVGTCEYTHSLIKYPVLYRCILHMFYIIYKFSM